MSYSNQPTTDALDILILQDFTGSQIPYIEKIRKAVEEISTKIQEHGRIVAEDVRYGLVAFRDHPPQDETFVTQVFPFSTKPGDLADNLASLTATGGGDGPECQAHALADALNVKWRDEATKVVILVTDSPPHGLGEDGDGFPDGCPSNIDPVQVASDMARAGITLFVLACEPVLSQYYTRAWDFYVGLTKITGGGVFDLGNPKVLPDLIAGAAIQALQIDRLVAQSVDEIHSLAKNGDLVLDAIADQLYSELDAREVTLRVLVVQEMHVENSEIVNSNIDVWFKAKTIAEARNKIREVPGNRITEPYLAGLTQEYAKFEDLSIDNAQVQIIVQKCLLKK